MNCKNLKFRTKNRTKYIYCSILKKEITYDNCKNCEHKEYKCIVKCNSLCKNNKKMFQNVNKSAKSIKGKKHKLTKATEIPMKVKKEVWKRDNGCCIFCGQEVSISCANSHVIKRSQLGLGIPQNIVCACHICHDKYDFGVNVLWMQEMAKNYLKTHYLNWSENDVKYKKTL